MIASSVAWGTRLLCGIGIVVSAELYHETFCSAETYSVSSDFAMTAHIIP